MFEFSQNIDFFPHYCRTNIIVVKIKERREKKITSYPYEFKFRSSLSRINRRISCFKLSGFISRYLVLFSVARIA